ncbi:NAD-specific glutamate dehydrogenase [compost metagenome]
MLAQYTGNLVVIGVLERVLEHFGDFAIGQAVGRLDLNAGFDARTQFASGNTEQTVGIDLEGHANLRRTRHHCRDTAQFEARQGAAVADQLALALQHVDRHGRLAVFIGGEVLGASDGDGGVARNHLLHQAAHGFQAQGQRNHVEQQQFATIALVTGQGISLDRSTDGDHLIRVDFSQGLATEGFGDSFANARYASRTTDHDHGVHVFQLDTGITHRTTAGFEAARDHRLDQRIEGFTGQLGLPVAIGHFNGRRIGQGFLGRTGGLQQVALRTGIEVGGQTGALDDPARDRVVEVIAAQGAVAAGGQDFEDTAGQAQNRNIEGTAAQVVNGDQAFGMLVQAISHSGSSRLIEQTQHIQAGQLGRILGGLTLSVIEIGRNGDHRTHQLTTQGLLGTLAQDLEDIGGHFDRAFRALDRVDERHVRLAADKAVGQLLAQLLDVGQATTHQALDRQHGVQGIGGGSQLGGFANLDPISVIAYGRRQDDPPLHVSQRLGKSTAQCSDQRIGSAQVDPHSQTTLVRLRTLAGFGDLQ